MNYTERIDGIQIRSMTYLPGYEPKEDKREFDIVKWEEEKEPYLACDYKTGQMKIITEYCYSLGKLQWNEKDEDFVFISVGTRCFKTHISEAAANMIVKFCENKANEYMKQDNYDEDWEEH